MARADFEEVQRMQREEAAKGAGGAALGGAARKLGALEWAFDG